MFARTFAGSTTINHAAILAPGHEFGNLGDKDSVVAGLENESNPAGNDQSARPIPMA